MDVIRTLEAVADRLDALAETALLMGDVEGAAHLREQASARRLQAWPCSTADGPAAGASPSPSTSTRRSGPGDFDGRTNR